MTVMERLKEKRVVEFEAEDDGTFWVTEMCDEYFCEKLTKDELLQLSEELKTLAGGDHD